MSSIDSNLSRNEQIILQARIHWAPILISIPLMFILIGFITIIPTLIVINTTELAITNKKLSGKTGLFRTKSMDSPLNKINNIIVHQGIFGKIFNFGNLHINTSSGTYNYQFIISPNEFKNALNNQIDIYDEDRINKQAEILAKSMNNFAHI